MADKAQKDDDKSERQHDDDLDEAPAARSEIWSSGEISLKQSSDEEKPAPIENPKAQQVIKLEAPVINSITTTTTIQNETTTRQKGKKRTSSSGAQADKPLVKSGRVRHIIAIFALSSIVLANMNRQAYNQALARMIRRPSTATNHSSDHNAKLTIASSPVKSDFADYMTTTQVPHHRPSEDEQTLTQMIDDDDVDHLEEGFDWSSKQISVLQLSFSVGYSVFMIPGGRMSEIYGAKWVIFISGFGSALCSLMTPFLAHYSFNLLAASRVLMGLCQTGISPALYALLSRWLPSDESTVYLPMIKVGVMIGFMSGSLINGFLPWPLVFYSLGLLGFAWSALWVLYASSLPSGHKFIGEAEQLYIKESLERAKAKSVPREELKEKVTQESGDNNKSSGPPASAPWLEIITNPVVLAFTFTKFTVKFSTDTQTMQIPMYLRNVFEVSDQLNGILNGANFAIQAVFTGVVAYVAKEMVMRQQFGLHKTGIRRLFQGINCFGMSLAYLLITFNMGSLELVCCAVILLSITSMFGAGGEAVLPIDLTTEYSASIMAIANSVANISGIVLPPIVSFFLGNQLNSSTNWNHIWWFVSGVMACGGLIFVLVVKAKIQGFDDGQNKRKKANKEVELERGESRHTSGQLNGLRSKSKPAESVVAIEMTGNCTSSV